MGGLEVTPKRKYSWLVGLDLRGDQRYECGGTIINDLYILTAAHCLYNWQTMFYFKNVPVTVGIADHNQFSTTDDLPSITRRVPVLKYIIHPFFTLLSPKNDIALLRLKEPLDFSTSNVQPACLPQDDSDTYAGRTGTVVGWGTTSEGGVRPHNLMEVTVPILDPQCGGRRVGGQGIWDTMLCAGGIDGKGPCNGDSGGALTVRENWGPVVVGLVSFSEGCARRDVPTVYTRVSKFLSWIRQNTVNAVFSSC